MRKFKTCLLLAAVIFLVADLPGLPINKPGSHLCLQSPQDTINQVLYNGRVWRNLYSYIRSHQFLYTNEFLDGTVTVNGIVYDNARLRYDIFNDELMIMNDRDIILLLNKELVDRFTLTYNFVINRFKKLEEDSSSVLNGYVNSLYEGKVSLYVKYKKDIELRAVDNNFDSFYQFHRAFVMKDGEPRQVKNGKQLRKIFSDRKHEVRDFIRKNKIKMSGKRPESFIPVVEFYDSIIK